MLSQQARTTRATEGGPSQAYWQGGTEASMPHQPLLPPKQGSDASFVFVDHDQPHDSSPEYEEEYEEVEPEEVQPESTTRNDQASCSSMVPLHNSSGVAPSSSGSRSETDFHQVQEAQVANDIQEVQKAAYEYTLKLTAGLKSAIGGIQASWWAPHSQAQHAAAQGVPSKGQAVAELQELLGLLPEENLVEAFKCKLVQAYSCSHNCFTPAIQMAFQGTLYITDKHCCFMVEERNSKLPFKVLHRDIKRAVRKRPQRKGDASDVLHLSHDSSGQQYMAFKDFEANSALENALALVQHLMEE